MSLFAIETKGRVKIRGIALSFKTEDTPHGAWTKVLVDDHRDFTVYGTLPTNIAAKVKAGDEIEFIATLRIRTGTYAIFKRPSNARIIKNEK